MAKHAHSTPALAIQRGRPRTVQQRKFLEAAVDEMLVAVQVVLDRLDLIDGDADFEPSLGAVNGHAPAFTQRAWTQGLVGDLELQCEDEGADSDREPDDDNACNWQDEGDQTRLRALEFGPTRRRRRASSGGGR